MRNRLVALKPALLSVLFLSLAVGACAPMESPETAGTATGQFDPQDFSGIWLGRGPRSNEHPPLTPAGMEMIADRRPDYLVDVPTDGNDPMYQCNPQGFPRLAWDENEPFEFIHLGDRILQNFQWDRVATEIWMDGRPLPTGENLDNIGPNWYGHSVAEWEGDTLVVNTTGFNEDAWPDEYGNPLGFDARVESRYTRIDADTIEGQVTFYDPANYTEPWVHEPPTLFNRLPEEEVSYFGWYGLFSGVTDAICAPMYELGDFNARQRDPAIFGSND